MALLPERFGALVEPVEGAEIRTYGSHSELSRWLPVAEALWADLWPLDKMREIVAGAARLRWLSTHAAGTDNLPHALLQERGVMVTNAAGLQAAAVAEFAVLLMLTASTGLSSLLRGVALRNWPAPEPGRRELEGNAALVVGMGAIGSALAVRLRAFGMRVTGAGRRPGPDRLSPDEWRVRLDEFDWVVLTAALTPSTRHLVGAPELAAMRKSAWLVNVSRGALIDERALTEALRQGSIAGACLDVTDPEPPAPGSPLWELPNLLLTPHVAGFSISQDSKAAELFTANLARFAAGRPLRNAVDLEAGY
jgi:phosphoglycerate dehydrogenase-like enzyme